MATALLCSPVLSDAATLTASNTATNFNVDNLKNYKPSERWRSTTTTPYIEGDFGAAKAIDVWCLGFLNAVASDTVRLRLATSQANLTAAPGYDSTAVSAYPGGADLSTWSRIHSWRVIGSTQTYRWFRVDFGFASNPAGFVDFARLLMGTKIQFETSVEFGWRRLYPTLQVWSRDMGGGITPRPQPVGNGFEVRWGWLTKAEAFGSLSPLLRNRGSSGDVLLLLDPDEATYPQDWSCIGLIGGEFAFANPYHNVFNAGFQIIEA